MQAIKLVSTINLPHKEWMYYRNNGITGSRIAAIMGVSPFDTPLSVYLEMTGQSQPKEQTDAMYFGSVLEDFIGWEFTNRTGLEIEKINAILQHPIYDKFLANIDFGVNAEEQALLECKNVGEYMHKDWKEGAPKYYYMQGQWYLGVTGLKTVYFAALCGGNKFIIHKYNRDEKLIETMYEKANDFWYCHIEPQIPPEAIEGDSATLKTLYPQHEDGKTIELEDSEVSLVGNLFNTKVALEQAEESYNLAKIKMQERMGDAEVVNHNGLPIATWKTNAKSRVFLVKGL